MHFREECRHGVLVSQCRCPSTDKTVRIVPCPVGCYDKGSMIQPGASIAVNNTNEPEAVTSCHC